MFKQLIHIMFPIGVGHIYALCIYYIIFFKTFGVRMMPLLKLPAATALQRT